MLLILWGVRGEDVPKHRGTASRTTNLGWVNFRFSPLKSTPFWIKKRGIFPKISGPPPNFITSTRIPSNHTISINTHGRIEGGAWFGVLLKAKELS